MLHELEGGEVKDLQTLGNEATLLKNLAQAKAIRTDLART
jgi:hypothetical protein